MPVGAYDQTLTSPIVNYLTKSAPEFQKNTYQTYHTIILFLDLFIPRKTMNWRVYALFQYCAFFAYYFLVNIDGKIRKK